MAAVLRRREQLFLQMQMQMNNPQNADMMMMRAAAAANANAGAAGLGGRSAFLMGNPTDLGAGLSAPMSTNAFAAAQQRMNSLPSASLMGNLGGNPMSNSTTSPMMRGFSSGQMPAGGSQNPQAMAAAAASSPNFPPAAAMGGNSTLSDSVMSKAAATEPAAKRLAPARGVFNKNIKSKDEMIDSLARANARFYKNDAKKAGQRFRGYQCEQWTQKYQELLEFQAEHGNW